MEKKKDDSVKTLVKSTPKRLHEDIPRIDPTHYYELHIPTFKR